MPGLDSMFSNSNLNPFELFGISSRQNWWEGPNVCIDRKVLTGDQEAEAETENPETEVTTPPPVPPRLRSKQPSFLARSSNEDSAISSSASSSSNDVHVLSSNQNSPPQRYSCNKIHNYMLNSNFLPKLKCLFLK